MSIKPAVRVFHLERVEDVSGVSGTGRIAEGIEFSDGTCVIRWLSHTPCTNIYNNLKQLDLIHGHDGATKVVIDWEDMEEKEVEENQEKTVG